MDKVNKWIEENGCPEYCRYCLYEYDCSKDIVCYGGQPIEPHCEGLEPEDFLDIDSIYIDLENGLI